MTDEEFAELERMSRAFFIGDKHAGAGREPADLPASVPDKPSNIGPDEFALFESWQRANWHSVPTLWGAWHARARVALASREAPPAPALAAPSEQEQGHPTESLAEKPEAVGGGPDKPTRFAVMEAGEWARQEVEQRLEEILDVEVLGINFDTYDCSFEIYPMPEVADVVVTADMHTQIRALGCLRYWINFPDGSERYCTGERTPTSGNSWERFNNGPPRSSSAASGNSATARSNEIDQYGVLAEGHQSERSETAKENGK